jgi:hypothetical protein
MISQGGGGGGFVDPTTGELLFGDMTLPG